ncbi:S41 family peptidase [Arenimonas sp.]|uniref:S41 family peptidase n=1 Tax=Arenimonas sp. TaxID=1872635 RepID=UPI0035B144B4
MRHLVALSFALLPALALAQAQAPVAAPVDPTDPVVAQTQPADVPLAEIRRYVSVYNAVKDAYVEPVDDQRLMKSALRGLLSDLDPHSAYLEKEAAEALLDDTRGEYVGIGVETERRPDDTLLVVAPIDGTPAHRAGLRAGDIIVAIDGEPLSGNTSPHHDLRGDAGEPVTITLTRVGAVDPIDLTIVREAITVTSVSSRLLEPGYAYLRISTFQTDTGPQMRRQLRKLAGDTGDALRGLVLDLRSNPGGLLSAAVEAADALLDEGLIVRTQGRLPYSNASFHAKPGDLIKGAPVIVLVDTGTASAAEVLAGALRDHGRASVMGSRTYGKGSVQTVVPLDNGDSIKLTTARYYTPSGSSIQARGIRPDIVLRGEAARGLREQDLAGHLAGEGESVAKAGEVIEGDIAIGRALDALKGGAATARARRRF